MATRLGMKRNVACAGLRKVRDNAIDGLDHQVHIDGRFDAEVAQGIANHRTNRQVWHEVIVHYVEVNNVSTGIQYGFDVVAQAGEIGGEYRRGDQGRHG